MNSLRDANEVIGQDFRFAILAGIHTPEYNRQGRPLRRRECPERNHFRVPLRVTVFCGAGVAR
jgi:hypothetical protein